MEELIVIVANSGLNREAFTSRIRNVSDNRKQAMPVNFRIREG
jgi:hypothetical protein